jgi:hypothetical protein
MKTKPITPYNRLMSRFKEFANDVEFRKRKAMWMYPKNKLTESWELKTLYERVSAAEQLGYDVRLLATDDGLEVQYIEKNPKRPWGI